MTATECMTCCSSHRPGWLIQVLYGILILWTTEMHGLSDFSNYLFRIINTHSARACDGERVLLRCPRHSTISVGSAFYGQREARGDPETASCQRHAASCSASTALQKMLLECQGHRYCQILVHPHLFGRDPCPGTPKHLHVSYSCKPTEHKNRTRCEGDQMLLHCRYPRVLNVYSAVYGREQGNREVCLKEEEQTPPFECLCHGALDVVRRACYGKQRCLLHIDDEHFRNPCFPGTRKYLTVLYSCIPQSLLKEADPNYFRTTSLPSETTKPGDPSLPKQNGIRPIVSSSLMTYGYITEHVEMAGLLFVSSVCLGLFVVLLVVSVRITCNRHREGASCSDEKRGLQEPNTEDDDGDNGEEEEGSEALTDSSTADLGRKVYCWEEVTYTTEAAELMERLERRDMIIQEIGMNAYINGMSCTLHCPKHMQ
ncbi:protein eva-1 homolog C isoform X1 [Electrophorus electricus]|uniref:protein eva-1 homolog C isoform X1 n=2 Tax=Electrophorus electricus TaxID=8005 RepID=UPI0015D02D56|nr:protein eva-1 homolog C isoform X1 [Electrophorus electricus]